ncbi:MAG: HEAT repeat domain-containing protein [Crocosphaera sp.]
MNPIKAFTPGYAVEIVAPYYGTGYRIGGRLILTCRHLFKEKDDTCKVRFRKKFDYLDKQDIDAQVIWKAPDNIDIALVELPKDIDNCPAVAFGNLPDANSTETIDFDCLGFPHFLRYSEDRIEYATGLHIKGIIKVADRAPNGHLILNIIDKTIQPTDKQLDKVPQDTSPWQGTSGSAIISDGLVVGVQSKDPLRDRPAALEAESLARVYNDQKWCEELTKHGINPTPIQVSSNWLSEEEKREAVKDLLQEIESFHNKIKLFHSSEELTIRNQYIPIQVTLNIRDQDKLENMGSYAETEAELRKIYALKGSSEEQIKEGIKKIEKDWNKAKENQDYIIVLADPGMGKSTLLRMEVCHKVEQSLQELNKGNSLENISIPLFIRLSSLADEEDLSIYDAILKLVKETYSRLLKHQDNETISIFLNELIEQKLKKGQCLLLLDALDEVSDFQEKRNKLIQKLDDFVNNLPCPIIVTSRIVGYGRILTNKGKEMEIVPFTQQQTEDYINTWVNNAKDHVKDSSINAPNLIKAVKERPQLSGLAQNPLLLSLICSLYQEDKLKFPAKRGQIYEQAVNYMLTKWCIDNDRKASNEAEIETKQEILMTLAYQFSKKGTEVFSLRELKKKIKDYLRQDNATDLDNTSNHLITELSDKDGILKKLNPDKSDYLFLHRTFQEYFTALYLKYQIEDNEETGIEIVKKYFWDYDWHETIIILVGLLDKPMVLIEAIRGEKDDIFKTQLFLAGRCLGECDVIEHHKVDKIINGVVEWWKQYPRIEFFEIVWIEIGRGYDKAVEELVSALKHEDSYVRRRALEILGNIGTKEALDGLEFAFDYGDINMKNSVANIFLELLVEASGEIGSDKLVESLVPDLKYEDEDEYMFEKMFRVNVLEKVGGKKAVVGLLSALHDEDSGVRRRAAEALGNIGSDKAVNELLSAFKDKDFDLRRSAEEALEKIGGKEAIVGLLSTLHDEDEDIVVRRNAAESLLKIGSEETVEWLLSNAITDDNQSPMTIIWDHSVGLKLGEIGSEKVVNGLLSALNHQDWFVRVRAVYALENTDSDKAVDGLLSALKDKSIGVRWRAAEVLANMSIKKIVKDLLSKKAVNELLSALKDENSHVRMYAAKALGNIGSDKAVNELLSALKDEDKFVRMRVAGALGKIGIKDKEVEEGLISLLQDEDSDVNSRALWALKNIGSYKAVEGLIAALKHEKKIVRENVAGALGSLGKTGGKEAVHGLLSALKDKEPSVREKVARALGDIGSEEAVEGLIAALKHEKKIVRDYGEGIFKALRPDVRGNAVYALGQIGSLTVLESLIQCPYINLYDEDFFPVARRLAIKHSKSGSSFIPLYQEYLHF